MMPLGLSGSCQDSETLFRDVFSFLITATGEGAGWETQMDTVKGERESEFLYCEVQRKFSFQCRILAIVYGSC